jgi:hypothetical protein
MASGVVYDYGPPSALCNGLRHSDQKGCHYACGHRRHECSRQGRSGSPGRTIRKQGLIDYPSLLPDGNEAWLIASRSGGMLWAFVLLFSFSYGGLASIFPLATSEFFDLRAMGSVFGFILLGATVGGMVGPPLGGYIFDLTQN